MIEFKFRLCGRGWIEAELADGDHKISISASYLTDAPADLLTAVNQLLNGRQEATCCWQEEPGAYQWVLTKEGRNVQIELRWYEKAFPKYSDNAPVVFSGNDELVCVARHILKAFDARTLGISETEYHSIWGYEYPETELFRLRACIKNLNQT
jgi:hypothetical protein